MLTAEELIKEVICCKNKPKASKDKKIVFKYKGKKLRISVVCADSKKIKFFLRKDR